jgi:RNA polymerase sigma-70 factor, ECF subfamily
MTDDEAFEAFVRAYQDMVYGTAVRMLGNPSEAEDVAQTVFLKAYERFAQIRSSPAAAGWLRTIARNACLNHLSRYRSRWRLFSEMDTTVNTDEEADYDAQIPALGSFARDVEEAEAHAHLERAMWALPDHQRVPLVLFHFEELSYEEIAVALGVSLAKVKIDIYRAREALRRALSTHHGTS